MLIAAIDGDIVATSIILSTNWVVVIKVPSVWGESKDHSYIWWWAL